MTDVPVLPPPEFLRGRTRFNVNDIILAEDDRNAAYDDAVEYLKYGMIVYTIVDRCDPADLAILVNVSPPRVIYPRIRVTEDGKFILGVDKTKQPKSIKSSTYNYKDDVAPFVEVSPDYVYDVYDIFALGYPYAYPYTLPRKNINWVNESDNDCIVFDMYKSPKNVCKYNKCN